MKHLFMGMIVSVAMCAAALAQDTTPSSPDQSAAPAATSPAQPQSAMQPPANDPGSTPSSANTAKIAPGSVIPVQLTKTVDAKKAKTGDQIVAMVTQDMRNPAGEVLLPKDTKVIGHVTEAQARNKEQKESQLAIAFDQAVLKSGQVQVAMSIQAVVAPPSNNNSDSESSASSGTPTPGSPAGGMTSPMGSRSPAGGGQQQQQPMPQAGDSGGSQGSKRPPINAQTQGVIGISNMTLAAGSSPTQGSVLTSDKNNVKLETGTLLLLKVQ